MSLDVYLSGDKTVKRPRGSGIFVREGGKTVEISRDEWYKRNPGRTPVTYTPDDDETNELYHDNITHNMVAMAKECGLAFMWDSRITKAETLIEPLMKGYRELCGKPELYKKFNPDNGWGSYEALVEFAGNYLLACLRYPNAKVEVSI